MAEDFDLGARQSSSIDDAGVVQFVGDDEIVFAEQRRNRTRIRGEARLKDHAGFDVLEAGNLLFQLHVDLHGAGDGTHRARTHTVLLSGLQRRFAQLGMGGQAEVIVRREVDHFLPVECADGGLLVIKYAQFEVSALLFEVVQLIGEIGKRVNTGAGSHEM